MLTTDQQLYIAISVVPPTSLKVEYFNTISRTIIVTNISGNRVLIENVTLRFKTDSAEAALNPRTECGWELGPGEARDVKVDVTPTPLYLAATNTFDVRVMYRITDNGQVSGQHSKVFPSSSFIIINEPETHIGQVFISLKQPEDLVLGRLMAKMARRAGFISFLKDDNQRLTEDIWIATIEPALRSSLACIVIWTDNTDWKAKGVEREIAFCRKNELRIPEALFLEQSLTVPQFYEGTTIEYTRFDTENPGKAFATGVEALRRRLQG